MCTFLFKNNAVHLSKAMLTKWLMSVNTYLDHAGQQGSKANGNECVHVGKALQQVVGDDGCGDFGLNVQKHIATILRLATLLRVGRRTWPMGG